MLTGRVNDIPQALLDIVPAHCPLWGRTGTAQTPFAANAPPQGATHWPNVD